MNRVAIAALVLGFGLVVAAFAWIFRPLGPLAAGAILILAAVRTMRQKS
jgi:hypothetical protein